MTVKPPWMGIVPLLKRIHRVLSLLFPYEDTARIQTSMNQKMGSHQTSTLILDFCMPSTMKDKFLGFRSHLVYGNLLYQSELRHVENPISTQRENTGTISKVFHKLMTLVIIPKDIRKNLFKLCGKNILVRGNIVMRRCR